MKGFFNRKGAVARLGSLTGMCIFAAALPVQASELTVRIAHVAPLSGPQAHYGKDNESGARLAIEDLNKMKLQIGGKLARFELVSEDDGADPRTATVIAQKLCDQKVNGVVGHLNSGTSIPASRIYYNCAIPMVTPSASTPRVTQQGFDSVFRVIAHDGVLGVSLANYAVGKMGAKTFVVIDDRTGYGQPLADIFAKQVQAKGGRVLERHYTNDKATNFAPILTAIRRSNPDVIFYGGMDSQAGPLLRQMKQLGIRSKFVGGDGICTNELLRLAGDSIGEHIICAEGGIALDKMPKGPDFQARFRSRFKTDIQVYAPFVYDAVMTMAMAMRQANSADPKVYLPKLKTIRHEGVIGTVAFDDVGDIENAAVTIHTYANNAKRVVEVLN